MRGDERLVIDVLITARAVHVGDEVAKAGERVRVDPLVAADLVEVGRATLCDPADAAVLAGARRDELRKVMSRARSAPSSWTPWQPIR